MNIDYIVETYCVNKAKPELKCNGNCHLAKQLSITNDTTKNDLGTFKGFINVFYPVYYHQQDYNVLKPILAEHIRQLLWDYNNQSPKGYITSTYHPPELKYITSA